jgi:hypothetical protein
MFNTFLVRFIFGNVLLVALISVGLLSLYNHAAHGQTSTVVESVFQSE